MVEWRLGDLSLDLARPLAAGIVNVTVTEGAMGDGFYEAVVSTLVERR